MPDAWEPFFVAQVGGSAALTGLVFVALSINLRQIMELQMLVGRAAEALVLLVEPVVLGLVVLMPYGSLRTNGLLCVAASVIAFVTVNRILYGARVEGRARPRHEYLSAVAMVEVALLPGLVGSVLLATSTTAGLAWIAFGAVLSIAVGIVDAWVLLVEILR